MVPVARRFAPILDREVQYGLAFRIFSHWMLLIVVQAVALFFWTYLSGLPDTSFDRAFATFVSQCVPLIVTSLALLPVFMLDTIKLSTRIVGPIVRLRRKLRAMASGEDTKPLAFRENDYWSALAEDFNKAMSLAGKAPEGATAPVGLKSPVGPGELVQS